MLLGLRFIGLSMMAPVVNSNGLLLLKKMNLLPAPQPSFEGFLSDYTRILMCCLWICIICMIIWSVWLESKITVDFWGGSYLFKKNEFVEAGQIIKNLPEPRRIDRRSSSISVKSSISAVDAV